MEAALTRALDRIRGDVLGEGGLTMAALLARQPGKQTKPPFGRSLLHDDITALVVELPGGPAAPGARPAAVAAGHARTLSAFADGPAVRDDQAPPEGAAGGGEGAGGPAARLRRQTVEALPEAEEVMMTSLAPPYSLYTAG